MLMFSFIVGAGLMKLNPESSLTYIVGRCLAFSSAILSAHR